MKSIPKHIAIIPDGNRRWARNKNLKPWEGHFEGAKRFEELVNEAFRFGVKSLSFWGSSVDNLTKRPFKEKRALLSIYEEYFTKLISNEKIFTDKVKINIVGDWEQQFPDRLVKLLREGIHKTKKHTNFQLNFLLAYNGDLDILSAIKNIAKQVEEKNLIVDDITGEVVADNLMSSELPTVDLVVRTGSKNDPHNSAGFLMWQTQNSQLYFTEKQFPDFTVQEFQKALQNFAGRQRRLGG